MSFTDPISITIGGVAYSFARVASGNLVASYQTSDGLRRLDISHVRSKKRDRVRTLFKFTEVRIAVDPFIPATNVQVSDSVHLVIDRPIVSFTQSDIVNQCAGVFTYLQASTNAALIKLFSMES